MAGVALADPQTEPIGMGVANRGDLSTDVWVPVSYLESGKAYFLSVGVSGRQVSVFLLKDRQGYYHAAFNACQSCFREGKGYRQEGDFMVCNNCGKAFASVQIGEMHGGCNPAPLPMKMEGQYLVVSREDIVSGTRLFPSRGY